MSSVTLAAPRVVERARSRRRAHVALRDSQRPTRTSAHARCDVPAATRWYKSSAHGREGAIRRTEALRAQLWPRLDARRARGRARRYLGRKSALKQALREVRDRETGHVLNALREQLEAGGRRARGGARRAPISTAGCRRSSVDVTLPGAGAPRGQLHLDHPGPPGGRGRLPRPRLHGRRRPRGRDDALQLRRARTSRRRIRRARRCSRSS